MLLYFGMLVLCGYLLVIYCTCVCSLRAFVYLGMSVVCLLVHLELDFDSLLEGTVFRFLDSVLWCFVFATAALLETCFCYLCAVSVSNRFYLSMSKCKLQTVGLFHVYNLNFNIDSSNFK